jgi:propanol-preferring alcohol dehydrogenase
VCWETLRETQKNIGYSMSGGFADYVIADPDYIGPLPQSVSFVDIAPVLCTGVTVYKGLKATETRARRHQCTARAKVRPRIS